MSLRFAHLAQRLFNVPLALHPAKAEVIMAALAERLGVTHIVRNLAAAEARVDSDWFASEGGVGTDTKPYAVVQGIAVLEVSGTLVQKLGSCRPYSGMTGYDGLRSCFVDAVADPAIRGICLDIDSPGGEVAGCFDLADTIVAARGRKPVHAVLTETAFSAAYAIASAADRISVPRTGGVGSVGVIALLVDLSKAIAADGITVNIIQYGARKADGSPYVPLPDAAREKFQQQIDAMGELFVGTVARNRGLDPRAVRDTEAGTFMGEDGVRVGLADAVAAPDAAFRALLAAT